MKLTTINQLRLIAKRILAEENKKSKLRVFDFDDTLVYSTGAVSVTHQNGEKSTMDSATFAYYKDSEGEQIDFTDFNNVTNPRVIKKNFEAFKKCVEDPDTETVILTARPKGSSSSVQKFLSHMGINNINVVALQSSNPKDKAKWIDNRIDEGGYKDVEFTDDSKRNAEAVATISKPNVKLTCYNPDRPSKEEHFDGDYIKEKFISDNPTNAVLVTNKKPSQNSEKQESLDKSKSEWWESQSSEFKKEYLREHPDSRYSSVKGKTIMANTEDMINGLKKSAQKSKNQKVKSYVLGPLVRKIESAGNFSGVFMEQLERDIMKAKPKGYFSGFEQSDFIELKNILNEIWD